MAMVLEAISTLMINKIIMVHNNKKVRVLLIFEHFELKVKCKYKKGEID